MKVRVRVENGCIEVPCTCEERGVRQDGCKLSLKTTCNFCKICKMRKQLMQETFARAATYPLNHH